MEKSTSGDSPDQSDSQQPVVVKVDAQEIGTLHVTGTTPTGYMQYLLSKFKEAGVPVEGALSLKLAHGVVLRFKRSPPGMFLYIWLPEELWDRMRQAGGLMP
jgi:hypothetical protein